MMNRRNAITQLSLLLGGTLSMPTVQAMSRLEKREIVTPINSNFSLTNEQRSLIAEVAEQIIPKTDTPGAIEAGVPAFVEMMVQDCYREPEQQSFMAGIEQLQQQNFLSKNGAEKVDMLTKLEADTKEQMKTYQVKQTKMGDNEDKEVMKAQLKGLPFWRLMKELTLLGYFTSEKGLNANFEYVPVPGKFELIKLKPGQKLYAY
ncbi:gluconate 2-dehydrogenase subunit 3 family protein [Spirosoma spitsbergense]|uniref:gluconate 2-dehydrogenase subunit 3 family protein n=1 Tax=Spirosoma spitsbergense TaxID=431554 RepID=UPI00036F08AB|nr:gluconate 2-dehydrogenase subunit 3 family protein [Spirosoma spitsbergense]